MDKPELPALTVNWEQHCNAVLAADTDGAELAESLVARWRENADWIKPTALDPDYLESLPYSWQDLLGFAFAQDDFGIHARKHVVAAFKTALEQFGPALSKGTVWLEDTLSLRHLLYKTGDVNITLAAMDLMLDALSHIPGHFPETNFVQYQLFFGVYDLATTCLISELREPELIEASFVSGTRLLPASHKTLFHHMRRFVDEKANRASGDRRYKEFEQWSIRYDRQQCVADDLFETLNQLNPGFETNQLAPDANLSFARELDPAWFRLAHIYSDVEVGARVIKVLRKLRTGNDALFVIDNSELSWTRSCSSAAHNDLTVDVNGRYKWSVETQSVLLHAAA